MAAKNKIRTVFYAHEGLKTFVDRLVNVQGFKSESDAISYLCALGMTAHNQRLAQEESHERPQPVRE